MFRPLVPVFQTILFICASIIKTEIVKSYVFFYFCKHFSTKFQAPKKCRMATSPNGPFQQITDSTFDHRYTRIGSSQGKNSLKIFD